MELMQCFEQGCKREVIYACPCDSPKILSCEKHFGKHAAQPNKAHAIEKIFVELCKGTKEAILGFFTKEQSKNSKLKEKILASFSQRLIESESDIEGLLKDLDSDSAELSNYSTKISQIQKLLKSEQDPILGLLSLHPDEAIEKLKKIIPANREMYSSAKLFCGFNEKVEKMIGHFIEDKFETYLNARLSSIENTFEEHNKSTISSNEKFEDLNKRTFSIENTLEEHNKATSSSNSKFDILNTRFSNIENTLEEYNKFTNSSNGKFEDISKRLTNIENIFEEHNKVINSSNVKFDILNTRLSNIENTHEEHNKATNSSNNKLEDLSKRFSNIENTLKGHNKAINSSNKKLEEIRIRFSNIENTLEEHNKSTNSNNEKFEDISKRFSSIENALEEHNKAANSSSNKFEDLIKKFSNIENTLKGYNKAIISSHKKFEEIRKRFSNIENTLVEHNKSTNSSNEKFEEISKRFSNIENALEEYNKAKNSSNIKFGDLSKRFSKIENTLEGHHKAINSNNDEHKNIIKSMGDELANIKDTISNLINENKKCCKILENLKEEINLKMENEMDQINSKIINVNQDLKKNNQFLNSQNILQEIRDKRLEILNKPNGPELEKEFRENCSIYQNYTCIYDPPIQQAYQDYNLAYSQKTSLYGIIKVNNKPNLFIYDTERESREVRVLETPEPLDYGTCITQLPNGNLFFFGSISPVSGICLIIDENYIIQHQPSGTPCRSSSSIYFNNSVYCFGGCKCGDLTLSERFDLNKKKWIKLKPLPQADYRCTNIIFNGNILISGQNNKNILRYLIANNTFITIPYDFAIDKRKILINSERLYLIECGNGSVYESEVSNDSVWRRIGDSIIPYNLDQVYLIYNKGAINIAYGDWSGIQCFKFNLKEKTLLEWEV